MSHGSMVRPYMWNCSFIFFMRPRISIICVCPSVGLSVRPSVRPSVGNAFVKMGEKWIFTNSRLDNTYDLQKVGRSEKEGRTDEEEGATRRKEQGEE